MEAEHRNVALALWGGSNREWTTGNYLLPTTPEKEWLWAYRLEWDGVVVEDTVGGYENDDSGANDGGRLVEVQHLRRKAISIETLSAEAPTRIHAMLVEVAKENGGAFADVQNDGVIDAKDMLNLEDVKHVYEKLHVNKAELLGLRLYTGKLINIL